MKFENEKKELDKFPRLIIDTTLEAAEHFILTSFSNK